MKTAEEVLTDIKKMESTERWKIVKMVSDFTSNSSNNQVDLIIDLHEEISKLKQDIAYLSGKVGLHDMYFNRIENTKAKNPLD